MGELREAQRTEGVLVQTHIGGQALLEGVMMRGRYNWAVAVRQPDGSIYTDERISEFNAVTAQARYAGSRESAASAREHYELTEEKYKVGKAGVADYNDARNSWLRAESEHIQARFQCLYQTRLLDFYRGRELNF